MFFLGLFAGVVITLFIMDIYSLKSTPPASATKPEEKTEVREVKAPPLPTVSSRSYYERPRHSSYNSGTGKFSMTPMSLEHDGLNGLRPRR